MVNAQERFNKEVRHLLDAGQRQHAAVYSGSFLDFDWTSGDVIFANSTCYEEGLMRDMSIMAQKLKPGAIMVTFTRGLLEIEGKFELLEKKRQKMSWGPATVFIHRRLKEDGMPVGPPNLNILPCDTVEYEDPADRGDDSDDDEEEEDEDEDDFSEEDDEEEDSEESEEDDEDVEFDSDYDSEEARWVDEEMADFKARHAQYLPAEKPAPQSPGGARTRLSVQPPSPGPSAGIMGGMGGFSSPQDSSLQKRKAAKKAFSGWSN